MRDVSYVAPIQDRGETPNDKPERGKMSADSLTRLMANLVVEYAAGPQFDSLSSIALARRLVLRVPNVCPIPFR